MFRTHRQRVPAMLAVACVGMMVYAVAGAAPNDGRELAPAEATVPAAKSGSDPTATTAKGDKSATKDDCKEPTTSTTRKDGDGKDGDGKGGSTSTTSKDGDGKGGSTSTTSKDGDGKGGSGSTPTTDKDGKGDSGSTPTTDKDNKGDVAPKAAVNAAADKGDTTVTTAKGDSGKDDPGKDEPGKDNCEPTTPTTDKGGKGSTTTTTKKGGGNDTTTTTDRKDRPTTSTTAKPNTVEPTTPSGGDPGSGGTDSGGSPDPGAAPIEPQEAPPYDPSYDQPVDDPEAADPGAFDDEGWYEMPEEGPIEMEDDEYAFGPMAPGEAQPVIPTFSRYNPRSGEKASVSGDRGSRRERSGRNRDQQLAEAPLVMSSSGVVQASSGSTESAAVSRRLGGMQASATESAFPADIISTPKIFPINRRDPLAAAALVLLVGVSRELFRAWRRRASDYWPA
jgi:hypothetical protein